MARKLLRPLPSLVFIGMPSAGKTTIGGLCAEMLGLPFVDFDTLIEKRTGKSPSEIFDTKGEKYFRQLEAELAIEFSHRGGLVISPGGGIVERAANMEHLRDGNIVIRLERDIALADRRDRPLLRKKGALEALLKRRGPLYAKYADLTLDNNGSPVECAERAAEVYRNREI